MHEINEQEDPGYPEWKRELNRLGYHAAHYRYPDDDFTCDRNVEPEVDTVLEAFNRIESDNESLHLALKELTKALVMVVEADDCSSYYTCDSSELWTDEDIVLEDGKPLCPWIVRPGKCQPEVAMQILKEALADIQKETTDAT